MEPEAAVRFINGILKHSSLWGQDREAIEMGRGALDLVTLARFAIQEGKSKAEVYKLITNPMPGETGS